MRVRDLNWFQLEEYLRRDDRIVLPLGSTEQHAYLSLETDNILAERVAAEAAEPLGVPVLPVLAYGLTPSFGAYPGSPTLRVATLVAVVQDLLDSLHSQGFRRILIVNGHGGNAPADSARREWGAAHVDAEVLFHNWWIGPRVSRLVQELDPGASHASWMENFPWTRLPDVELPTERKKPLPQPLPRAKRNARGGRGRPVRRLLCAARRGRSPCLGRGRRRDPVAPRTRLGYSRIVIGVPSGSTCASRTMSRLRRRMQP